MQLPTITFIIFVQCRTYTPQLTNSQSIIIHSQLPYDWWSSPPSVKTIRTARSIESIYLLGSDTRLMAVERRNFDCEDTASHVTAFVFDLTGKEEEDHFDNEEDIRKISMMRRKPMKKFSKAMKVKYMISCCFMRHIHSNMFNSTSSSVRTLLNIRLFKGCENIRLYL